MLRSLFVLILLWVAFQFAVMSFAGMRSSSGGHGPSPSGLHRALSAWPEDSRRLALKIVDEYGMPDGVNEQSLWWIRPDDSRIVIYRGERAERTARSASAAGGSMTYRSAPAGAGMP